MPRRKAEYPANPLLRATHQQITFIQIKRRRIRQKGREIILENKCAGVFRILCAVRSFISRAQVAGRIIDRQILRRSLFHSPKPGPLRSMRGNQHPLACQWIESSVWHFLQQRSVHAIHKPRRLALAFLSGSPWEGYRPSSPPTLHPATPHIYKCPGAAQSRIRTPQKLASEIPRRAPRPQS